MIDRGSPGCAMLAADSAHSGTWRRRAHALAIMFRGHSSGAASASRCALVVDLHAIHADVALAGVAGRG